jgi:hypothetical protein
MLGAEEYLAEAVVLEKRAAQLREEVAHLERLLEVADQQ